MATVQDLERALVNADRAGDANAARTLAVALRDARASASAAPAPPGPVAGQGGTILGIAGAPPAQQPAAAPMDPLGPVKGLEVVPAVVSAATTGQLGGAANWLLQMAVEGFRGNLSDPEAGKRISAAYDEGVKALTYQPRTQAGQEVTAATADALAKLAPVAGLQGEMAALSQGLKAAAPAAAITGAAAADTAAQATTAARQAVTTLPRRAVQALSREPATPTPGTMGSAGAAATDVALQRVATAESLGLTGDAALTRGQATRDAGQLKFETETAKLPDQGGRLRQRRVAQNEALLSEIERDIDITGAEAPNLRAVGESVDKALVQQYRSDKGEVTAAYRKARNSPEAAAIVDQTAPVALGEGERAITGTPIDYINAQPEGLPSTGVTDAARKYAVKLGVAELRDGELVPLPATIDQMERWRSAISQNAGREPADKLHATILKGFIDGQTEPVAGPLYRQARNMRARLAQNYEDRSVIAKLLDNKRGTSDRAVALEDVFSHSILRGSLDDVRNVRRVLHRSGEPGQQAWRELQGQTLKYLRDEATKSVAADSAGNRVISPAALDRAVRGLEHDGKLDFIFGKRGAQRLRDINDIAQVAKTVPPEAGVNFSNTATTLLAAFGDVGASAVIGIPAPLATATRLGLKHIKDRRLRQRIDDALAGFTTTSAP